MTTLGINSTNRVQHAKVRESTFGVTPANPAFKQLRVTSSGLNANPVTVVSEEIRSDRQVADLILVGQKAGGDIGAELSFNSSDDDIEEVLQSSWATTPNVINTASNTPISALSTTTITVTSGGAAFLAGMIAILAGMPTAANNGVPAVVASNTSSTVVFPSSTWTAETVAIPVGAYIRTVGFQGASADIVATSTGLTSTALDFTTLGLVAGQWIKLGGAAAGQQFATSANNAFVRISVVAAHALTFDRLPTGWASDVGTGKTIRIWFGDYIRNGATQISNTIERQYLDQSPVGYEYLTGMCLDKMSLTIAAQTIVKVTKSYLGSFGSIATSRVSGATDTAPPAYSVMNASSNFGRVAIAGTQVVGPNFVMSMTMDIMNNLRQLSAVGSIGAVGMGNGEFNVKGKMDTYFGDATLYNYVLNNNPFSFDFRVQDSINPKESYVFDLPRVKFASGAPSISGKNQNVMISGEYDATRDPTLGFMIGIYRFFYAE